MSLLLFQRRRTSSAFDPTSAGTLSGWFDASAITGKADGAPLSQWDDSSGNARHATQATGANQPLYKTGIINGLPAVLWDGVDDALSTASVSHGVGTGDFHWAAVIRTGTAFPTYKPVQANGNFAPGLYLSVTRLNLYFAGDHQTTTGLFVADTPYIVETFRQAGELTLAINGTAYPMGTVANSMPNGAMRLGWSGSPGETFQGHTAEHLFYASLPSAPARTQLRSYLSAKWGIAVS
jgi:hypothetical protein